MKKMLSGRVAVILMAVMLMATVASCRKGGINGDLDGQWQVMSIEAVETGAVTEPARLYYNLYLHTVNLTRGTVAHSGNMTYDEKGRQLTLEFPSSNVADLAPWGIYSRSTTFSVEQLDSESMVLLSAHSRIIFRKY